MASANATQPEPAVVYDDYEFDDLLETFEKNLVKNDARSPASFKAESMVKTSTYTPSIEKHFEVTDFKDELGYLLSHIQKCVLANRKPGTQDSASAGDADQLDNSIGREVMKNEIRSIVEKLHSYEELAVNPEEASGAARSTVLSLKRQIKESNEEITQLRRQKKQLEIQNRELHDCNDACEAKIALLTGKVRLHEIENDEKSSKMRNADTAIQTLTVEKKRLEQNITLLRGELLDSSHRTNQQKLKTIQAERQVEEMETRMMEMRMSEAALSERVKELHQVQEEMLEEMRKVIQSKDVPSARRALTKLSQRRARIVGKIAAIMARRHRNNDEGGEKARESGLTPNQAENEPSGEMPFNESSPSAHSNPSPSSKRFTAEDSSLQKLTSLLGRVRMGGPGNSVSNEGSPAVDRSNSAAHHSREVMSKADRHQSYESNLIKSREAAEKDAVALQEVVELKANEITRLENELKDAKGLVTKYEEQLQAEKQCRLKENRNLHHDDETLDDDRMHFASRRGTTKTLFDWQDYDTDPQISPVAASDEGEYVL